jgi:hypothetical protein
VIVAEEGPSQEAAPATKKRKIGTVVGGVGVSDHFAMELMGKDVFAQAPGVFGANAEGYRRSMAKERFDSPCGRRGHVYVSYGP